MICNNCGAEIDVLDSKCPYCGSLNPVGAESSYMEKLEDLREDTEELGDVPAEQYKQLLRHHGLFVLKIILIVIGVCCGIFLLIFTINSCTEKTEQENIRKEFAFQKEYFPLLDELYETGDDAQVLNYINDLYELDGSSALYHWEHHAYYIYYDTYETIQNVQKAIESDTYSAYDLTSGFYAAMSLTMEGIWESDYYSLSDEELDKITFFQQESKDFLSKTFDLTDENALQEAFEQCSKDGFLDYKRCEKYVSNYMED